MAVRRTGQGSPTTVFVPGGLGTIAEAEPWDVGVQGTGVFFDNESITPWDASDASAAAKPPRRQADRDADELLAVADDHQASRAIGMSRGARAILGVLTENPGRFERIALVLPPGGTAAGRYRSWLDVLAARDQEQDPPTGAEILIIAQRGDRGHPARVATEWADLLAARFELFPSGGLLKAHFERFRAVLLEFMNEAT